MGYCSVIGKDAECALAYDGFAMKLLTSLDRTL